MIKDTAALLKKKMHLENFDADSLEGKACLFLDAVVAIEVREDLVLLNGNNNASRRLKKKWMKDYRSVSCSFLMGAWFFDLMKEIFYRLTIRSMDLCTVAQEAYTEGLSRHHTWF